MMKKLHNAALVGVLLAAVSCGNPNAPDNEPTTIVFTAQLTTANEVPAVTNADAGATGTVTVTFNNLTYDVSGNVQSGTVDFAITLNGLPLATNVTAAHIHSGAAGTNGSVIIDTGLSAEGGVVLATGAGNINRAGIAGSASALATVIQNPALTYFNVHTSRNTGGAMRGQLVRQ